MSMHHHSSPMELYQAARCAAWENFYDRERLVGWERWISAFDGEIRTFHDAHRAIDQMLASLNDKYTEFKTAETVHNDEVKLATKPSPITSTMLPGDIAFIHISTFGHNDAVPLMDQAMCALEHARAFIIDLRGNRGGFIIAANNIASMFLDDAPLMITRICRKGRYTEERSDLEGTDLVYQEFDSDGVRINRRPFIRWRNVAGHKPVYVLIDDQTCSSAELMAGILHDHRRATFVGQVTSGKGIIQDEFNLPNGCHLRCTSGVYLTPSRHWFGDDGQTCAYGLRPDILVPEGAREDAFDVAFDALARQLHMPRRQWYTPAGIGSRLAAMAGTVRGGRAA